MKAKATARSDSMRAAQARGAGSTVFRWPALGGQQVADAEAQGDHPAERDGLMITPLVAPALVGLAHRALLTRRAVTPSPTSTSAGA
ncbi:hypothetical protein ALI22I_20810 [Saccharothrix sp. ALI-22-I]|nr:hypothetical protein ALI22I_20810 [Saccharothrix sp. ALI-22-I]